MILDHGSLLQMFVTIFPECKLFCINVTVGMDKPLAWLIVVRRERLFLGFLFRVYLFLIHNLNFQIFLTPKMTVYFHIFVEFCRV